MRTGSAALLLAGGLAALSGALLVANAPAGAEADSSTATLTLLGIRDSNCDVQTGGTTVYVAPGGDVKFQGELTGISVKVLGLTLPISSSKITSFNYKLVVNGDTKHPHYVNGKKSFTVNDVSRDESLSWSADSVDVTVLGLLGSTKSVTVPLSAKTVTGVPAGGKLDWTGRIVASSDTKCGIAEVPGGQASVGPIHVSVPPITHLPSQPSLPSIPGLPGGGSSSSSGHHPSGGHPSSSPPSKGGGGATGGRSGLPTSIPQLVVPNAGSGGDSAYGGGGLGGLGVQPDTGAGLASLAPGDVAGSSGSPPVSGAGKPVDLATKSTDGGLSAPQLPVLLAIVAIIALSLVTAAYARMYLLRKPSN